MWQSGSQSRHLLASESNLQALSQKGHIEQACHAKKSQPVAKTHYVNTDMVRQHEESLFTMNIEHTPSVMVQMSVNEKQLQMQVDTGASVSIISQRTWKQCFSQLKPVHSATVLKTHTGELLHVIGEITVDVKYNEQQVKHLPLLVVSGEGPSLLGRNWLCRIWLDWHNMCVLSPAYSVNELRKRFPELFKEGLRTVQGYKARLETDSPPRFFRPRSVPYALKDAIEQDLERMVCLGVLEKVSTRNWLLPLFLFPTVMEASGFVAIIKLQ